MSARHPDRPARRVWRANALLTGLLLAALLALGNDLARQHLVVRRDLSQDGLYALSDATRQILGRLEDRLQVKTYFTGRIESGAVQLAKAGVEGQLAELAAIAGPRMEVVALDPSSSTSAAADAAALGILPRTVRAQQGTQQVTQPVFLGLLLRYRGREQVLDFVEPNGFEVQFASAVYALVRDRRAVIGWYGPWQAARDGQLALRASFETARNLIERRHELEDVEPLEYGDPVPPEVEILFVVRPLELHPRAAFAIDQFVQRGGKLVVLVDQAQYSWAPPMERLDLERGPEPPPTGLESLLATWGALPTLHHVWDLDGAGEHLWLRAVGRDPATGNPRFDRQPLTTPILVRVGRDGLDGGHPITAGLEGLVLPWVQPIAPNGPQLPLPEGLERTDLITSSARAYHTQITDRHVVDQRDVQAKSTVEAGLRQPRRYALAAVLAGRFPSPFEGGAPAKLDPLGDGTEDAPRTTDEPVLSRAAESVVVVMGDADWLRDPDPYELLPFLGHPPHRHLLMNLVDWLTLDETLIALRKRVPRERALRDLEAEAREALGLIHAAPPDTRAELEERLRLEERARADAAAARWWRMLVPLGATLALVLGLGLAWNVWQGRRP